MDRDQKAGVRGDLAREEQLLGVPARQEPDWAVETCGLDLEPPHEVVGVFARRLYVNERPARHRARAIRLQDDVVHDAEVRHHAGPKPVLGDVADPAADDLEWGAVGDVGAAKQDAAFLHPAQPRDDLGKLPLAVPGDPGDAQDLTGCNLQRHAAQGEGPAVAKGAHAGDAQDAVAASRFLAGHRSAYLAPHHEVGEEAWGSVLPVERRDSAAVAKDRDPVGHLHDLVQLVCDEDDGAPGLFHAVQRGEKVPGFLGCEHGSGLVQDEDVRAAVEHLHDLHPLLLPDRKLPYLRPGIGLQPVAARKPRYVVLDGAHVQDEARLRHAEGDVLGDGEGLHEPEVLVHHAYACRYGMAGGAEVDPPAPDQDLPAVGAVEARKNIHQRALTGAILAEKGVDFTCADLEAYAVIGQHARKALRYVAHLNDVCGIGIGIHTGISRSRSRSPSPSTGTSINTDTN